MPSSVNDSHLILCNIGQNVNWKLKKRYDSNIIETHGQKKEKQCFLNVGQACWKIAHEKETMKIEENRVGKSVGDDEVLDGDNLEFQFQK